MAKKKEVAEKKRTSELTRSAEMEKLIAGVEIPADGIAIPDRYRQVLSPYNPNGDTTISREEFDQMPPALQRAIRIGLLKKNSRKTAP
jgi:hypothetical protein